jgi:deazaflavin-dependent oxidoreductase (nitroreductase family)
MMEYPQASLRQVFKYFNRFMLLMWRLGLGSSVNFWPAVVGRIMVLVHTGRKTGRMHRTPVNYASVDGEIYCVAGFGQISDWYRNVKANPAVEVWLPDGWWAGAAEEVVDPSLRLALIRQVLIASGFATYAAGINPHRLSDEALGKTTSDYCLMRIRRSAARTGPGGPADLAWFWQLATLIFILIVLFPKQRRKKNL